MSISKRLKAAGHRGPHPLAGWKAAAEWRLAVQDGPGRDDGPRDVETPGPVAGVALEVDQAGSLAAEPGDAEGRPVPGAVTPEGAWYRVGGSFYRQGEGPFPKWLHPTGQLGMPWRAPGPVADPSPPPPAAPRDVVRGVVVAKRLRKQSAVGQLCFLDTGSRSLADRVEVGGEGAR